MAAEDVFVFANPIAGRGRGGTIARGVADRLERDGFHVRQSFERPEHLTTNDIGKSLRAAVIIGGDGTLRAVVDRLLELSGGNCPPILPVPLGTANLMVRHLRFRWRSDTLEDSVSRAISRLHVTQLDAARANGRLFLVMAGVGFDAHIVHELDRLRTGPISMLNYLWPAALALRDFAFTPLCVTVDGERLAMNRPTIAFIGNIPEYGAGFPALPYARADDGVLDVCVLPCRSTLQLVRLFLHAAGGEHVLAEGAVYRRGRNILVESEAPVPVQVDGDPSGQTPVRFEMLATRLPFVTIQSSGKM